MRPTDDQLRYWAECTNAPIHFAMARELLAARRVVEAAKSAAIVLRLDDEPFPSLEAAIASYDREFGDCARVQDLDQKEQG